MSKQVNYNENLCAGAAIRDDKGRRISKLFEASHPKMTVGYAKNLIMPDTPTEQEFNFRQSGGGVIEDGVAVIDKVKGNSVVWNQLFNPQRVQYVRMNVVEDMGPTLKVQVNGRYPGILCTISLIKGHKYLAIFNITPANVYTSSEGFQFDVNGIKEYTSDSKSISVVFQDNQDYGAYPVEQTYEKPFFYDLTQMFGAGNEPSTYEEFLSRKPKVADEYAYNEGTIVNNKVEKVVTTGRNLWDEEWEVGRISSSDGTNISGTDSIRSKNYIPVDSRYTYYVFCKAMADNSQWLRMRFYDANKNYVGYANQQTSNGQMTFAAEVKYIRFFTYEGQYGPTYNHDICINLSDPIINGKYFPYEEHTLDLAWVKDIKDAEGVKLFEGGLKSVDSAFDEAAKGRAIKRIGVKVFDGTEDWALESINSYGIANFRTKGLSKILSAPLLSAKYPSQTTTIGETQTIGLFNANESSLYIRELSKDFASVDAWKAHLADLHAAGTPLVVYYELAEPIEVEYDEKSLTYPVVADGTEEAIASEPSSAFRADIGYGIDAVKTILDLKARVEALEGK